MRAVTPLTKNHWDKISDSMELRAATAVSKAQTLPCMIQGNLPACIVNLVETRTKGLIQRSP